MCSLLYEYINLEYVGLTREIEIGTDMCYMTHSGVVAAVGKEERLGLRAMYM